MSERGPGPEQPDGDAPDETQAWRPPAGAASGGYPQQSPGQQPYGQAPPGQPPYGGYAPPSHPSAGTVLVLGILGMVVCGVLAPFAWIKGNKALQEIDAQPGRWSGRDQVQIGRVLGIVGSVLLGLAVLFVLGMAVLFFVSAGAVITTSGF